jgi:hypothetical protein
MAIFHLSMRHISRRSGKTSVQSAAYITRSSLYESRRALNHNYSKRKADVAYSGTLVPTHASCYFRELSVWNKLELFEDAYAVKRYPHNLVYRDAYLNSVRTAMVLVVALPKELSIKKGKELVEIFATHCYVNQGLIVSYAVYDDEINPHAQLQVSRRSVLESGELSWAKNRAMCTRTALLDARKCWADMTNMYLKASGVDACVTELSSVELGNDALPTRHRGRVVYKRIKAVQHHTPTDEKQNYS